MKSKRCSSTLLIFLAVFTGMGILPATAQIQVNSTNPSAAPQGTVNLNVTISGNGFKRGAAAQWFVTGTTNPGGVTVNSTAFKSSSQLTANITIASGANLSGFDVVVKNSDGRSGKGTDLFVVTQPGTPIGCSTTGTPSGFTLQAVLNPVQANGAALITTLILGNAISVRPLDLNRDGVVDTLVAFVTSGSQNGSIPGTYVFFLDPVTGQPQAMNPITGASWQNPLQVLSGVQSRHAEAGDVNGDGIPDFILGSPAGGVAYLFVGSVSGSPSYTPSYAAYKISPPAGAPNWWAATVAMGDLDGDGKDEIAVTAFPNGKNQTGTPTVYIFKYTGSGVTLWERFQNPTGAGFAGGFYAVAIGNVTGGAGSDLAVVGGVPGGTNGVVFVFPYPASQSNYFTVSASVPNFGTGVGIADVNLDGFPDLVANAGSNQGGQTLVFAGPVHAGASYTNQLLPAANLVLNDWANPGFSVGNLQTVGGVAVGSIDAENGKGCSLTVGALQLFTSPYASSQQPNYVFEPPSLVGTKSNLEYGYSVDFAPGFPIILIGEHYRSVGTTSSAGQVYVYKKN